MFGLLIIIGIVTSCAQARHRRPADIITTLQNAGHYTKALAALNATTGLLDQLMNETDVTMFLPTDDAYLNATLRDVMDFHGDIQFHIVSNESIRIGNRVSDSVHNTMALEPLRLNVYNILGIFAAEGVEITERNMQTSNGYIHGLGGIMTPPEGNAVYLMSQRSELSTFHTLLNQTGLLDQVKNDHNITLFAPSEAAWHTAMDSATLTYLWSHQNLMKEVLLYHVIDRQTLYSIGMRHHLNFVTADHDHDRVVVIEDGSDHIFVNEAKVTEADISATNGVIHVVDRVLIPTKVMLELEAQNLVVIG